MTSSVTTIPRLPWADFIERFDWRQGEHLTLIGPTGSGKTTIELELLRRARRSHPWVVAFATKRRDPVLDQLAPLGFQRFDRWLMADPDITPRAIIAPPLPRGRRSVDDQRRVFREALECVFRQGGWTLLLDELRYVTEYLGLREDVELLWQQGRSLGVSVVAGAQRPRHVPLLAYDQATHLFLWHNTDKATTDRLAELGGRVDSEAVTKALQSLNFHEVLYLNTHNGEAVTTRAEV